MLSGQPAQQPGEGQRLGDGAVALGHRLERRIGPVARRGGTGEGLRQGAVTGADRGERRGGGEPEVAQREIERMHPGMGVGEPAGGLGDGHAGDAAPRAPRLGCGGGARVEPGERVGRGAERAEQRGADRRRDARRRTAAWLAAAGRGARAMPRPIGVGFVRGVLPGRPEPGVIVVRVGKRRVRGHGGVSPSR